MSKHWLIIIWPDWWQLWETFSWHLAVIPPPPTLSFISLESHWLEQTGASLVQSFPVGDGKTLRFDEINYFHCFFLRGKAKIMQQHVLGLEQTPPLPPAQTGRDSRRFWQDLQITAFLRGLAVHWLAGCLALPVWTLAALTVSLHHTCLLASAGWGNVVIFFPDDKQDFFCLHFVAGVENFFFQLRQFFSTSDIS